MHADDPYRLQRFIDAQADIYEQARAELRAGEKRSHWMWFVFPQVTGLGTSAVAHRYAIGSREEARVYLEHTVLGARLRECSGIVAGLDGRSVEEIFGYPDDLKFCSSMTLFDAVAPEQVFAETLRKYFGGRPDGATLERLGR